MPVSNRFDVMIALASYPVSHSIFPIERDFRIPKDAWFGQRLAQTPVVRHTERTP
jgi:hypothetical protein